VRVHVAAWIATLFIPGAALAQEQTLGALIKSGHHVTQMSVAEINDDFAHLLILVEGEQGGFLCKVEAGLDRDNITALLKEDRFPDIMGLKTSEAVKWRPCAQIY
jgi:hypothetical protein